MQIPENRTRKGYELVPGETLLIFRRMASPSPEISPRHRFEARIDIRLQRGEQKVNLQGWARDLSESGLRAFVADALVKGESVVFEIPLSDSDRQVIPAKVVRSLGTDYGFEFTALSAAQRSHIQAALRKCQPLPRPQAGATT
jgi:PilZ domain